MKTKLIVFAILLALGKWTSIPLHAADLPEAFTTSISDKGLVIKSKDDNFQFKFKGLLQTNYKDYLSGGTGLKDGFYLRRFRTDFRLTLYKIIETRLHSEWGTGTGQLLDGTVGLRFSDKLVLKTGKDKSFIGLERHQSPNDIVFPELALPSNLVPNRDLGVGLSGLVADKKVEYNVGVYNGVVDSEDTDTDGDSEKDIAARLFYLPVKNAGFGGAFSYGNRAGVKTTSTLLPTYKTPGQETLFAYNTNSFANGVIYRVSPQGYWYKGPWGVFGEYILSSQAVKNGSEGKRLNNDAWELTVNYVWTGETRTFDGGIQPKSNFNPEKGTWGAFETVFRINQLNVDSDAFPTFSTTSSYTRATAVGIGFNWFPFPVSKITLAIERAHLDAQSGGRDKDETVLILLHQIAF